MIKIIRIFTCTLICDYYSHAVTYTYSWATHFRFSIHFSHLLPAIANRPKSNNYYFVVTFDYHAVATSSSSGCDSLLFFVRLIIYAPKALTTDSIFHVSKVHAKPVQSASWDILFPVVSVCIYTSEPSIKTAK